MEREALENPEPGTTEWFKSRINDRCISEITEVRHCAGTPFRLNGVPVPTLVFGARRLARISNLIFRFAFWLGDYTVKLNHDTNWQFEVLDGVKRDAGQD